MCISGFATLLSAFLTTHGAVAGDEAPNFAITPSAQLIGDPALDPDEGIIRSEALREVTKSFWRR